MGSSIGMLLTTGLVLLMHPTFTAKAVVLPPQQGQSSAGLLEPVGKFCSSWQDWAVLAR